MAGRLVISCGNRRRGLARRLAARRPCRIVGLSALVKMLDVSREAGVSSATVSRVLTGSADVDPDTRKLVLAAVKKRNYRPNLVARGLRPVQPGDRADRHRYRKPFLYRDLPGRRRRCTGRLIFSHLVQCRQGYREGARVPEGRGGPKCLRGHHQPGVGAQD